MSKITYADKVAVNVNPDIPDINKVSADDMNEIKRVVNDNEIGNLITDGQSERAGYKIDGRDVYVKRINLGALPNAANKSVTHGLTNFTVIKFDALAIKSSDNTTIPLPYSNSVYVIELNINATAVSINTSIDRSAFNGYINIYYINN